VAARPRARATVTTLTTDGLVLRRIDLGEADSIFWVFTEQLGRVNVVARSARRAKSSAAGILEPLHTYRLRLEERAGQDLLVLKEAQMSRPRPGFLSELDAITLAARYLGWLRDALPSHCPEPEVWRASLSLQGIE
jgi:DNA repair protein RecO